MDNPSVSTRIISAAGAASPGERGQVGLGVVGLGAFGRFCLEAYTHMPEVRIVALADTDPSALAAGSRLAPHALACDDATLLMALPDVEVVAICAPPDRHLALVLAAALAGKHVVCDKPLGISLAEFDTAVAAATAHGVTLGINLVQRHNPLYTAVQGLAHSGVLGTVRRLAVENYADEAVGFGPGHWLWNPERSGGLALAADIHWLDLATRLLGPAHEVHAWEPSSAEGVGPRRLVTTAHPYGAVASVYHSFDTCPRATGCTVLVAFDEGEARVEGWIPARLTVTCPADRTAAVATLLGLTSLPEVSIGDDGRAVLVLHAGGDRRADYLEMIRETLRLVLDGARGGPDSGALAAARAATAAALAAEVSAATRGWVAIGAEGALEATG